MYSTTALYRSCFNSFDRRRYTNLFTLITNIGNRYRWYSRGIFVTYLCLIFTFFNILLCKKTVQNEWAESNKKIFLSLLDSSMFPLIGDH